MKVLGSIRLSTLIYIGALETLAAILICYGLAVSLGHVKPWLPMISDCAVYSPEKYLFRFMMALSTFLIGAQILMAHVANGYSKVSLFVGLLASLGLGIVSVINEEENTKVHGGAAVVFFLAYWIYMVLTTIISPTVNLTREYLSHRQGKQTCKYDRIEEEQVVHQPLPQLLHLFRTNYSWGLALRQLLTVLCGIDLVVVAFMSTHWGKYKLYIAICEWFGTFCIIAFNWSLGNALSSNFQLAEVIAN